MITSKALIEKFWNALSENWGYIWGTYGQLWTKEKQASATDEKARQYGAKWIGHRVADCSGLGYWAFSELGGFIVHGSNTIWNEYTTDHCELKDGKRTDGKPLYPGDPVFLKKVENGSVSRHHIGYYVGDDTVIEAKGTQWGVVTSPLSRWHETARWYNVLYDNGAYFGKLLTLKRGMRGEQVRLLQETLNELPAGAALDLKEDGIFGKDTEAAVKSFQADKGLTADGVVGPKTWAALGVSPESLSADANVSKQTPNDVPLPKESRARYIWDILYAVIRNPYGVAGLMGNLQAESGLNPENLQNTGERALGMTDAKYTAAVDSGAYTAEQFTDDGFGYGLAQWTYRTRKAALLRFAKEQDKSIGNLDIQLDFLLDELRFDYSRVWYTLQNAATVREASDEVLLDFERPKNQTEENQQKRAELGQKFYDEYAQASPAELPVAKPEETIAEDVKAALKTVYANLKMACDILYKLIEGE